MNASNENQNVVLDLDLGEMMSQMADQANDITQNELEHGSFTEETSNEQETTNSIGAEQLEQDIQNVVGVSWRNKACRCLGQKELIWPRLA